MRERFLLSSFVPLATAATLALAVHAQSIGPVTGIVLTDTGTPVSNARIRMPVADNRAAPVVRSDADGRFVIVPPTGDSQALIATKAGYAPVRVSSVRSGSAVELRMHRGATLAGHIRDESGDPVVGVRVAAERYSGADQPVQPGAASETDDRGAYRLSGLPSGTYVIKVATRMVTERTDAAGQRSAFATGWPVDTYYPGSDSVHNAQVMEVEWGDEREALDLTLAAPRAAMQRFSVANGLFSGPRPGPVTSVVSTGNVRGRVLGPDGVGLTHALVLLTPIDGQAGSRLTQTDDGGRFAFAALPPGPFEVSASKPGFTRRRSGLGASSAPPGLFALLRPGAMRASLDVDMVRWSAIEGQITDERGDPVPRTAVQLMQLRYASGRRQLVAAAAMSRLTDDRGTYRLFNVPPGRYLVTAALGGEGTEDVPGYARTYFPGTTMPTEARWIEVDQETEVTGIDFALSTTSTIRVSGRLVTAGGEPTTGGRLEMMPVDLAGESAHLALRARISPDGAFDFVNVSPGRYVIQSYRGRRQNNVESEFGALDVSVGTADLTGLVLQTSVGSDITGTVRLETRDAMRTVSEAHMVVEPVPVDVDRAPSEVAFVSPRTDGTFDLHGINGARRLQVSRLSRGWTLKAVRVHGVDVTDQVLPFGRADQSLDDVEIVVSDQPSRLTGTVTDAKGRTVAKASVVVFSTNPANWYPASRHIQIRIANGDGTYKVEGLPSGTYFIAAVERVPIEGSGAWQDPEFLDSLTTRVPQVTVQEGMMQTADARVLRP